MKEQQKETKAQACHSPTAASSSGNPWAGEKRVTDQWLTRAAHMPSSAWPTQSARPPAQWKAPPSRCDLRWRHHVLTGRRAPLAGVTTAGARLAPRPTWSRHSSPGQMSPNSSRKGITYSDWQKTKRIFKMRIKPDFIPFSPLFFLVRSIWSLSWILTCLSFGWSLMKGCFRSCSVEGRCM